MSAFEAIVGYEAVKNRLIRIADILRNPERYRQLGARPPRALMLHGKPGVGKTLMAHCLIEESGRAAFTCRKDSPNGAFVEVIKDTFEKAVQNAPSIVFLDDLDKFANEDERHRDAEEYVTVQSCIDSMGDADVFVLATANDIRCLPSSLKRQGRLGNMMHIDCPEGEDTEAIIARYLANKNLVGDIDTKLLARILGGHSCAELEEAMNEAALLAAYNREEHISTERLLRATLSLIFGVSFPEEGSEDAAYDEQRLLIAYHEAGHVVANEALDPGSVTLASILGRRGKREGGFTLAKRSDSLAFLDIAETNIVVSLGSRAAIEYHFGTEDVGCTSDLESAFSDARHLIEDACSRGFSLHSGQYGNSEALLYDIEQATAMEMERYYRKAKKAMAKNADFLDAVAHGLLERKILTMHDIAEIKREHPIALA